MLGGGGSVANALVLYIYIYIYIYVGDYSLPLDHFVLVVTL